MAERNDWDRDRDRERGRSDWDHNRKRDFNEHARDEWDRERGRESHGHDPRGNESGQRGEYRGGPQWGTESRHYWPEQRSDYNTRGDWGRQGTWSTYGNRPDYERENEWRRNPRSGDWSQPNPGEWNQRGGEWESGRHEPSERFNESGRMGGYAGGLGSYAGGMGAYSQRGRFSGRGPKGWHRSDERIQEDVNERLTDHPDIDASEVEVQVQNAEVTLSGSVDHRDSKRLAEDIAQSVSGVKDVHNQIRVEQPAMREPGITGSGTGSTSGAGNMSRK